jgi:hypothetical protein
VEHFTKFHSRDRLLALLIFSLAQHLKRRLQAQLRQATLAAWQGQNTLVFYARSYRAKNRLQHGWVRWKKLMQETDKI